MRLTAGNGWCNIKVGWKSISPFLFVPLLISDCFRPDCSQWHWFCRLLTSGSIYLPLVASNLCSLFKIVLRTLGVVRFRLILVALFLRSTFLLSLTLVDCKCTIYLYWSLALTLRRMLLDMIKHAKSLAFAVNVQQYIPSNLFHRAFNLRRFLSRCWQPFGWIVTEAHCQVHSCILHNVVELVDQSWALNRIGLCVALIFWGAVRNLGSLFLRELHCQRLIELNLTLLRHVYYKHYEYITGWHWRVLSRARAGRFGQLATPYQLSFMALGFTFLDDMVLSPETAFLRSSQRKVTQNWGYLKEWGQHEKENEWVISCFWKASES